MSGSPIKTQFSSRASLKPADAPGNVSSGILWEKNVAHGQTRVLLNFFDSIQLNLRKFWFWLNSWLTMAFKNWFKSTHDLKWFSEIWFKSTHDSNSFSVFRFKLTHDSKWVTFSPFWLLMTPFDHIDPRLEIICPMEFHIAHLPVKFNDSSFSVSRGLKGSMAHLASPPPPELISRKRSPKE